MNGKGAAVATGHAASCRPGCTGRGEIRCRYASAFSIRRETCLKEQFDRRCRSTIRICRSLTANGSIRLTVPRLARQMVDRDLGTTDRTEQASPISVRAGKCDGVRVSRAWYLSGDSWDDSRIRGLLVGKPSQPDDTQFNWDAKRVFGLDPKKFAVFGPDAPAKKIADALKAKGMTALVNPKYEIKPFVREPGRGGAGRHVRRRQPRKHLRAHHRPARPSAAGEVAGTRAHQSRGQRGLPRSRPGLHPVGHRLLPGWMAERLRPGRHRRRRGLAARCDQRQVAAGEAD